MTSSKPYLVRALYQWILDNGNTPHILIDTSAQRVVIPPGVGDDGTAVLNLAPQAVQHLEMSNDYLSFSARFNGVVREVYCPIEALMGIYARETGTGMMFPPEEGESDGGASGDDKSAGDGKRKEKPKGPTLKVIK